MAGGPWTKKEALALVREKRRASRNTKAWAKRPPNEALRSALTRLRVARRKTPRGHAVLDLTFLVDLSRFPGGLTEDEHTDLVDVLWSEANLLCEENGIDASTGNSGDGYVNLICTKKYSAKITKLEKAFRARTDSRPLVSGALSPRNLERVLHACDALHIPREGIDLFLRTAPRYAKAPAPVADVLGTVVYLYSRARLDEAAKKELRPFLTRRWLESVHGAIALGNVAGLLASRGELTRAMECLRRAVAKNHPRVGPAYLRRERAYDPLRKRADFEALLVHAVG